MDIILASGSPRRKELLEMLGIKDLRVIPALGEERPPQGAEPWETVMALAAAKGQEVAERCGEDALVIAADTIVWYGGRIFGKPKSEAQAAAMLRELSGAEHQVFTGLWVGRGGRELCQYEMTRVFFRELEDGEIADYVLSGEPMDKAGAYGAQGKAALFVRGIEGDFFNVMGLPLCRLGEMLKQQGVVLF